MFNLANIISDVERLHQLKIFIRDGGGAGQTWRSVFGPTED